MAPQTRHVPKGEQAILFAMCGHQWTGIAQNLGTKAAPHSAVAMSGETPEPSPDLKAGVAEQPHDSLRPLPSLAKAVVVVRVSWLRADHGEGSLAAH